MHAYRIPHKLLLLTDTSTSKHVGWKSSGRHLLFIRQIFCSSFKTSSYLPFTTSHLGDSGITNLLESARATNLCMNVDPYCRTQTYAGRVACCPLVSHVEYALCAVLRLEKDETDGRTDGRTPDLCVTLTARSGQRDNSMYMHTAMHDVMCNVFCDNSRIIDYRKTNYRNNPSLH